MSPPLAHAVHAKVNGARGRRPAVQACACMQLHSHASLVIALAKAHCTTPTRTPVARLAFCQYLLIGDKDLHGGSGKHAMSCNQLASHCFAATIIQARFISVTKPEALAGRSELEIRISVDKDKRQIILE